MWRMSWQHRLQIHFQRINLFNVRHESFTFLYYGTQSLKDNCNIIQIS